MGILTIMGMLAAKKIEKKFNSTAPVIKTPTPLGMHQGSAITLPSLDIALAQADGSIFKEPTGIQLVSAVGQHVLFGMNVFNSYLNDGNTFIQTVTDAAQKLQEARLFYLYQTVEMQSLEDWEFWLGRYHKDAQGQLIRDANGLGIMAEYGLIGWSTFSIDSVENGLYNRTWFQNKTGGIEPIKYIETIVDSAGNQAQVNHESCEYYKYLTESNDSIVESLLASMIQSDNKGSVDILIGIPLDVNSIKVLQA